MKRKRESSCLIDKRVCIQAVSNKRKLELVMGPNKKMFSNKDHYIKQLEQCILSMHKKMQELEYLLVIERQNNSYIHAI